MPAVTLRWTCSRTNKSPERPRRPLQHNADPQTTHGNNSTEVLEMPVSPEGYGCKGHRTSHLCLLYQSVVLSVIDYGLGLTTMPQTNLLKLDRVQNEAITVILGTTQDYGAPFVK